MWRKRKDKKKKNRVAYLISVFEGNSDVHTEMERAEEWRNWRGKSRSRYATDKRVSQNM